jgi:hypothetical protein
MFLASKAGGAEYCKQVRIVMHISGKKLERGVSQA